MGINSIVIQDSIPFCGGGKTKITYNFMTVIITLNT